MPFGHLSELVQDRLQRSFNRPVEIQSAPEGVRGGLYYIKNIKMDGAFEAADLLGQKCYADRLVPCVTAHAQLFSPDMSQNPAELLIQIPPAAEPNAKDPVFRAQASGEVFYPPLPEYLNESDLRIGTQEEYLGVIEAHARQLQMKLSSKQRGREQGG